MIEKIRAVFFKNALKKLLAEQKRQRKTHTLDSARTIGILFDASTDTARREMAVLVNKLEKDGKKVTQLGFINNRQQPENQVSDCFSLKETTWNGKPKGEKVATFSTQKFDLLLSFNPNELPPLEWLAIAAQASMKIGLATQHLHDFDIQLETPNGKGIHFFIEQLRLYLDKIVLTKS